MTRGISESFITIANGWKQKPTIEKALPVSFRDVLEAIDNLKEEGYSNKRILEILQETFNVV